jgi:hypothetical protein
VGQPAYTRVQQWSRARMPSKRVFFKKFFSSGLEKKSNEMA